MNGGRVKRLNERASRGQTTPTSTASPLQAFNLLLPVADKERMLWLAEKATELGVASWRPVAFKRSRDVNPRGEGPVFQQKVRARMKSALAQSGGAWLPAMYPDATVEHAIAARAEGAAVVLDADAPPMHDVVVALDVGGRVRLGAVEVTMPVTLVVGPEGGFEPSEREALEAGGFHPASLGATVLRFETAAVAGVAVLRAALARTVQRSS